MGRSALKGGAVRLLGNHHGPAGWAFRQCFDALAAEFDLSSPLIRLEASRVATQWANLVAATRALEQARGKYPPGAREIERASRRQALNDQSYAQGLDKLRAMLAGRRKLTMAEALARPPRLGRA